MNNLIQTYNNFGLNLDSIYLRCLSSLVEFKNFCNLFKKYMCFSYCFNNFEL